MHRMKTCWSVLLCGSMLTLLSGSPAAAQTHKPTAKKTPAHKRMLEQAIAALDDQLKTL